MHKTKSLENIEERLQNMEEGSLRHTTLKAARDFKMSWIKLGQMLYQIWREKAYKDWGYLTFEGYVGKEVGIRHQTASKLLKSYLFLEKEEPAYIRRDALAEEARTLDEGEALPDTKVPDYEAVNALRLAKGKLDEEAYRELRRGVLEEGREGKEVRQKVTALMREKAPPDPERERANRRKLVVGRLLRSMKSLGQESEFGQFLPRPLLKQLTDLTEKIEVELERH